MSCGTGSRGSLSSPPEGPYWQAEEYVRNADFGGRGAIAVPTTTAGEAMAIGLSRMREALEAIPDDEKAEYLEALTAVPDIVEHEIEPSRFLRAAGMDARAAADRLVAFWRERRRIFDDASAFLPMNITGEGAMSPADIDTLSAGSLAVLPPDATGRPVLCCDRARLSHDDINGNGGGGNSSRSELRCFFYMFCVLSEWEESQTSGVVCLHVLSRASFLKPLGHVHREATELLRTAMPIRGSCHHVICMPPPGQGRQLFLDIALPKTLRWLAASPTTVASTAFCERGGSESTKVHVADTEPEMLEKLRQHHFAAAGLPTCAGGTWRYECIFQWQEVRVLMERETLGQLAHLREKRQTQRQRQRRKPGAGRQIFDPVRRNRVSFVRDEERSEESSALRVEDATSSSVELVASASASGAVRVESPPRSMQQQAIKSVPLSSDSAAVVDSSKDAVKCISKLDVAHMKQAIDLMPNEDKAEYLAAVRSVPDLVETESPPCRFLRWANRDPYQAAERLVAYWAKRKDVFDRMAFFPLNCTGGGALSQEGMKYLDSSFVMELPRDCDGLTVLCLDRSKMDYTYRGCYRRFHELVLQCLFYRLQLASENDLSCTRGFVLLLVQSNPSMGVDREILDLAAHFPVRVKVIHLLCLVPAAVERIYLGTVVPAALKLFGDPFGALTTVHVCHREEDFADRLCACCGLVREGIPTSLGGAWEYDAGVFRRWNQERARIEREQQHRFLSRHPDTKRVRLAALEAESPRPSPLPPTSAGGFSPLPEDFRSSSSSSSEEDLHIAETEEMRIRALQELEEAIDFLGDDEKEAYMQARKKAPDLVWIESNPIRYLRFERYNTWAAALRLARYWSLKKEFFGEERAFLPMDLTGDGALSPQDIEVLRTGFIALLPMDREGRSVLLFDRSRLERHMFGSESKIRAAFYMFALVAQNEMTSQDGCIAIGVQSQRSYEEFDPVWLKQQWDLIYMRDGALLWKLKRGHMCCTSRGPLQRVFLERFVPFFMNMAGKCIRERISVYVKDEEMALVRKLEAQGLSREGLPPSVGGTWRYSRFVQWVDEERERGIRAAAAAASIGGVSESTRVHNKKREEVPELERLSRKRFRKRFRKR